jgi:hypothetical protein
MIFIVDTARFFALLIGILTIYAALFLYEDDEGKLQNRIEIWWIRLNDLEKSSRLRLATFAQAIAQLTGRFLDCLFGKPLRLLRLAGISLSFSAASFYVSLRGYLRNSSSFSQSLSASSTTLGTNIYIRRSWRSCGFHFLGIDAFNFQKQMAAEAVVYFVHH